MIRRYRLGTIFSWHSKQHLIFSTLASCPSTAKNGTWIGNEVRDRVISNYLILSCCQSQAWWQSQQRIVIDFWNSIEFLVTPVWFGHPFLFWSWLDIMWQQEWGHHHPFNFSFPFCQRCMIHLSLWADSEENATLKADSWETFLLFGEKCVPLHSVRCEF